MFSNIEVVLLDIEGTTSSIAFVHAVMFPYAKDRVVSFVQDNFSRPDLAEVWQQFAIDAGNESFEVWKAKSDLPPAELVIQEAQSLMAKDAKATGLKALQGHIWKAGFESGELQAEVYPDVIPTINQWRTQGLSVGIYSSGSIAAQKLFFGHLAEHGDQLGLFDCHFDTTIGGKKVAESYVAIAKSLSERPESILFVSDIADELIAAQASQFQVVASLRPGNHPLPNDFSIPTVTSFAEIEIR